MENLDGLGMTFIVKILYKFQKRLEGAEPSTLHLKIKIVKLSSQFRDGQVKNDISLYSKT